MSVIQLPATYTLTLRVDDNHPDAARIVRALRLLRDDPRWELRDSWARSNVKRRVRTLTLYATVADGSDVTEAEFRAAVAGMITDEHAGEDED